jgi:hypothetical protein
MDKVAGLVSLFFLCAYLLYLLDVGLPTRSHFVDECATHQPLDVCEANADALFGKED